MNIQRPSTLADLARLTGAMLRNGEAVTVITGVHTLQHAGPTEITWLSDSRHVGKLATCKAAAVIMHTDGGPTPMAALLSADPEESIARVLEHFAPPQERPAVGIHTTAQLGTGAICGEGAAIGAHVHLGDHAQVGPNTIIHAGCHIAAGATIGRDCILHPHVFVGDRCVLGDRVVVKPNAVIGSDGFGFIFRDGRHRRVPQIGIVVIEDDVEVGANTCIDRAKVGATLIGRGVKIDNLVQVAHNCQVGSMCILVAQVGLSGSVRLGAGAVLGGQSGVADGLTVADGIRIGAQSGVIGDLTARGDYLGSPAQPTREALRQMALARRLPDLMAEVKDLKQRLADLERAMHH